MEQSTLIPLIVVGFILVFSVMWLAVTTLLGKASGWYRLQDIYPDRMDRAIKTMHMQSAQMGGVALMPVNFGKCLTFQVCSTGLRIVLPRFLGLFHKPLFVPWGELRVEEAKRVLFDQRQLIFGNPEQGAMLVWKKTADRIAEASPVAIPMP